MRFFAAVGIGGWFAFTGLVLAQQSTNDITKREVTDPLLKIKSLKQSFPEGDPFFKLASYPVVDRSKKPEVFNRLWGKNGVILLEPLGPNKPAEMDFSGITSSRTGHMRLAVHKHPYGESELEVYKGDKCLKKWAMRGSGTWEYIPVDFDHEQVRLVLKANGWSYEFAFVNYVIEKRGGTGTASGGFSNFSTVKK
jgi:hypothetical protein